MPNKIINQCDKLVYTTYASALLTDDEFENLKNDMLDFLDFHSNYKLCYFYKIDNLTDIPDNRKNIVNSYFPKFADPEKSQSLINSYQGKNNIFYTGGYLSFEIIEAICLHVQTNVINKISMCL